MRVLLAALVVVGCFATARADGNPDDRVGLVVQGPAGLRGRLEDHLTSQLRREGFTAVDSPMSRDALNTLANCFIIEDLTCARGVVEARAKTHRLLYVRVDQAGQIITVDLSWFSAGNTPIGAKATCDSCSETFTTQADQPLRHLAASAPAPIVSDADADEKPETPPSRLVPISMIAGGSVTLVAGGVCLYYGLRDGASHKYVYPQLTPIGISLLAVGAGVAIAGYILMPAGSSISHPVVSVSGSGAYLGWSRAF